MLASGMLASDVDIHRLAASTNRFSGAEIAGVVRAASSYALERYVCIIHSSHTALSMFSNF